MKYFNAKRYIDLKRMEADIINRAVGNTYRVLSTKHLDRAMCDAAIGPALKGETMRARGSIERRKGGVMPGKAFV